MTREETIIKLLGLFRLEALLQAASDVCRRQPNNYSMHMLKSSLCSQDTSNSWFTALAVLSIYQRVMAAYLLQKAIIASGQPPVSGKTRKQLLDALAENSKLTKADAG